jgi:hypothetical protein
MENIKVLRLIRINKYTLIDMNDISSVHFEFDKNDILKGCKVFLKSEISSEEKPYKCDASVAQFLIDHAESVYDHNNDNKEKS